MWNGQYKLDSIKDETILREFYDEAISLAESIDFTELTSASWQRQALAGITASEFLDKYLSLKSHNCVFNRYEYSQRQIPGRIGEISCTDIPNSKYLKIDISIDNLNALVTKYKLSTVKI